MMIGEKRIRTPVVPVSIVSTEALRSVADALGSTPGLCRSLGEELREVQSSAAYAAWLKCGEARGEPFTVAPGQHPCIEHLGLVENSALTIKINALGGCLLLTDGMWVPGALRVFPFVDESQLILDFVEQNGFSRAAETVLDLATGSGNQIIALTPGPFKMALDINPRALAYAEINRCINGLQPILLGRNDIRSGVPEWVVERLAGRVLVLANMPFAPAPHGVRMPLSIEGGERGSDLTLAALKAVKLMAAAARPRATIRALLLCYSLGSTLRGNWEVVDAARDAFGPEQVSWKLLENEKLWRVNGHKDQLNPMNLRSGLRLKANCRFSVDAEHSAEIAKSYDRLAEELNTEGWDVLGYGLLTVTGMTNDAPPHATM